MIHDLHAEKILDSRGNWTVRAYINGISGNAPSGASTGSMEAKVIPAGQAVKNINSKLKKMIGDKLDQKEVDIRLEAIDGTDDFSKLGANASIAVSFAAFNAIHRKHRITQEVFPYPLGNIYGGGAHGGSATFQEFLSLPAKARDMEDALETNAQLYHRLKENLMKKAGHIGMNDEGALTSDLDELKSLDIITDIAEDLGCRIGLDVAASEFYRKGNYVYKSLGKEMTPAEHLDFLKEIQEKYKLAYIEDPFEENDLDNTACLTKAVGKDCLISGDDLFVTNESILSRGIRDGAGNSLIIKPNQVGTITLAHDTFSLAKKNGYMPVLSHRSGETCDSTISRLALLWGAPIIKAGVVDMRISKLNELLRLWNMAENPRMASLGNRF